MSKLTLPALYAIINLNEKDDCKDYLKDRSTLLVASLKASLQIIQLRCKNICERDLEKLVEDICQFREEIDSKSLIILNDHVSIAHKYNLQGIHLGQNDDNPRSVRDLCGTDMIIGQSCHNLNNLESAPTEILDYLACGPIYNSTTKVGHAPVVGLDDLNQFCRQSPLPVVAIGGICLENAAQVFKAGAASCAVISELTRYKNVSSLAEEFNSARSKI